MSGGLPGTVGTTYDSVNGIYTLVSAGAMGSNTVLTDALQFAYKQISGNFTMIARVTGLELPSGLSTANVRAGLQIRNSLADNTRYYGVVLRGSGKVYWEQRLNDAGAVSSSTVTTDTATTPLWLKLQRADQTITVSWSKDGITYSTAKSQTFSAANSATALDSQVYVGLSGVSGSTTVTSTATFDNVSITAN